MASSSANKHAFGAALVCFLVSLLLLSPALAGAGAGAGTEGGVNCEELPQDLCAFAVSWSSRRCLLENTQQMGRPTEYECRTSEVVVERGRGLSNWIETEECVHQCGVERATVGISSDSLLEARFAHSLCSPPCYHNCPNIIDLYFNLAAAEGVVLSELCEAHRRNPQRAVLELLSSSGAAPAAPLPGGGLVSKMGVAAAPSPLPSPSSSITPY